MIAGAAAVYPMTFDTINFSPAAGLSHSGTETQHTLLKAAVRLDSVHTADSLESGLKNTPDLQPASGASHSTAIQDLVVEQQPSLQTEASLARQITLGKLGTVGTDPLQLQDYASQAPLYSVDHELPGNQHAGSAEGTEMLSMGSAPDRQVEFLSAPVCSSPPREAWPSILLQPQPQDQSLPTQPCPASLQLPDSASNQAQESPFSALEQGEDPEKRPPLLPEPFGSSVIHRASEDRQDPLGVIQERFATALEPDSALHGVAGGSGRGPANDMLFTPSRLSRASSAMCQDDVAAQQAIPATPMSTAAECSSPPSMAAVCHGRDEGRPAGTPAFLLSLSRHIQYLPTSPAQPKSTLSAGV